VDSPIGQLRNWLQPWVISMNFPFKLRVILDRYWIDVGSLRQKVQSIADITLGRNIIGVIDRYGAIILVMLWLT
jgi:hypothetical protein